MDKQGTELNQLSRLLFDKAAFLWQCSIGLGFLSGIVGLCSSLFSSSQFVNTTSAAVAATILTISYWQRFRFENVHDAAETMRRQSVLSEGLGWPISKSQFSEWRSQAGTKILNVANQNPRPEDYYETKENSGPKRLAEMTFESLFWTKNLYRKIQTYLRWAIFLAVILLSGILLTTPLFDLGETARLMIVYFVYLLIPILISLDLLGMDFRLRRAIASMSVVETELERLANEAAPTVEEVLRLTSEYNCILASGLPIPKWVFDQHHAAIQAYWKA